MKTISFLYSHWRRILLLAGACWSTFGVTFWGLINWQALFALLILAVWVIATLALPRRPRPTQKTE